ncbi:hypothetical protein Tco_0678448 [Tanacetum coccineum]|uniref:Reverse transcriptase domain-containing protein n=1 Tax=Tanacetum coccineum TaxID=301880 RepID=A0ABQ4XF95_9ASTR
MSQKLLFHRFFCIFFDASFPPNLAFMSFHRDLAIYSIIEKMRMMSIRPEVCLPPRKRLCFALGPRYEFGESSSATATRPNGGLRADYGFVATMDRSQSGSRHDEFATRVRQDTDEIYVRLEDEQTERKLMVGRLNMLYRDRRAHARTSLLLEREARMSQEAWVRSMDASDLAHSKVMSLRTTILGQQAVITELQAADRKRQAAITELLAADRRRQAQFIEAMIDQGVTAALAVRDADRNTNGDDSHNSGTGVRRTERTVRECTYTDFLKCQPLNFKGMEGVAGLSQWFERMEFVFHISNCIVENQVKFATCTLHSVALTLLVHSCKISGHECRCTGSMLGKTLMKMMTNKLFVLEMKSETGMKILGSEGEGISLNWKNMSRGLPTMIPWDGSVVASKPKTMQEAVEIATELMDKKICTFADRTGEKKLYGGSKPLCPKCNYHHDGLCAPKCHKCNRVGHLATRDCRSPANANTVNNQRGIGIAGNVNASAKVYAVGHVGTNPDSNFMTSTFLLNNHYASILFDTGVDRSFVSTAFSP